MDTMIAQIKSWLQKLFAWTWRRTSPAEYRQASGPLSAVTSSEGISRAAIEGSASQPSLAPRFSTIEERPRPAPSPTTDETGETSPLFPPAAGERKAAQAPPASSSGEHSNASAVSSTPTARQRLEFLRYLVERGIVSDWTEDR